jgi:stage II sporulation protein D
MTKTRTTALLVLALAALGVSSAEGAWTVKGRGFGHGVGLSQYGAYGFAENGRSYKQILGHYYTGTKLGKAGGGPVRVLLDSGQESVPFSGAARACGEGLDPNRDYSFAADGGGVVLRGNGGDRLAACGAEGKAGSKLRIAGGRYRGNLIARNDDGKLLVINSLGLEAYVKGVVANEVPASWPRQALQAQAVVARSYGLATSRSGPFDHYDDTRSQVYDGLSSETKATNAAVAATKREVVTYNGDPIVTYYFSTSGGQTENSEFGFSGGTALPYLKSVKDPFDDLSPVHRWTERFSDDEMESELVGLFSGRLQKIEVIERGKSPRIVRARVVGSNGGQVVTGDTLRARLGLRSTWARFKHR